VPAVRNRQQLGAFFATEDATMRKVISALDDTHRKALLELTDFGAAAFSAGLIVGVLRNLVGLAS
jgi:hypothetical protein